MEIKRIGLDKRYQSAVMYTVMAFSFCLFLWIFFTGESPDVCFNNENSSVIAGEWTIEYQGEKVQSPLPGPFSAGQGNPIRYSIELGDYETEGNSIMFRASHAYVRIYLDGELINESGYGQKTIFGDAPYNSWVITRLPEQWKGKTLSIEIVKYYDSFSGQLREVSIGTKNTLVFQVIQGCMPAILFNFAIILAAFLLLGYSFIIKQKYVTYQLRSLCIFSIVTCTWLVLESGGYQIFLGNAPLVSNTLFLLFYLIPPAGIRFILSYESFKNDRLMNLFYWLSIVNCVVVLFLQLAGIRDFIESLIGAHVLLVLVTAELIFRFVWRILRGEWVKDIQLMTACVFFAIFASLDIIRFYTEGADINSAYFSQIGVLLFFGILIYFVMQQITEEREESMKRELLEQMAYTDILTDLPNRNAFEKRMDLIRDSYNFGRIAIVADLNELKRINDRWGHQKGDKALMFAADVLKRSIQDTEEVYRIGGDEFCILSDRISEEEAQTLADEIERSLEESEAKLGFPVTMAVGWAKEDECGIDLAFRRADFTMYEKKQRMKRERKQEEIRFESLTCGCGGRIDETE